MEPVIRQGTVDDAEALLGLFREYHRELLPFGMNYELNEEALPRVLQTKLRSRLILTLVAEDSAGRLKGFVFCSIRRLPPEYLCGGETHVGYLDELYVTPDCRGTPCAGKMYDYAEEWLKEQGMSMIEFQHLSKNKKVMEHWSNHGLIPVGYLYCKQL